MSLVVVHNHGDAIELTLVIADIEKMHALVNDGTISPDAWLALERCLQVRTVAVTSTQSIRGRDSDFRKGLVDLLASGFMKDLEE